MNTQTEHRKRADLFYWLLALTWTSLKLAGFIHWSWLWVLSPLWIPPSLYLIVFAAAFAFYKRKQ